MTIDPLSSAYVTNGRPRLTVSRHRNDRVIIRSYSVSLPPPLVDGPQQPRGRIKVKTEPISTHRILHLKFNRLRMHVGVLRFDQQRDIAILQTIVDVHLWLVRFRVSSQMQSRDAIFRRLGFDKDQRLFRRAQDRTR